jgi:hypothetical protein
LEFPAALTLYCLRPSSVDLRPSLLKILSASASVIQLTHLLSPDCHTPPSFHAQKYTQLKLRENVFHYEWNKNSGVPLVILINVRGRVRRPHSLRGMCQADGDEIAAHRPGDYLCAPVSQTQTMADARAVLLLRKMSAVAAASGLT